MVLPTSYHCCDGSLRSEMDWTLRVKFLTPLDECMSHHNVYLGAIMSTWPEPTLSYPVRWWEPGPCQPRHQPVSCRSVSCWIYFASYATTVGEGASFKCLLCAGQFSRCSTEMISLNPYQSCDGGYQTKGLYPHPQLFSWVVWTLSGRKIGKTDIFSIQIEEITKLSVCKTTCLSALQDW